MTNEKIETVVANKLEKSTHRGPGAHLHRAREAKGLSIEDVARKLFLTSKMVRQLESDDYKGSPAVTFMRGYLRSYARLVDVDADLLIAEFNALGLVDTPPVMSTQRIYHRETSILNKVIPWAGTIIGICVILFVVMWVHSEFSDNGTSVGNVASSIASTVSSVVTDNKAPPASAPQTNNAAAANTVANNVTNTNSTGTATENLPNNNLANNQNQTNMLTTSVNTPNTTITADSTAANSDTAVNTTKKDQQNIIAVHPTKNKFASKENNKENIAQSKAPTVTAKKQEMAMPF